MTDGNKPMEKFKAGAISATVWKNEVEKDGKTFDNFSITVERNYVEDPKAETPVWKKTSSMRVQDLPKVELVCNKAYEYIVTKSFE